MKSAGPARRRRLRMAAYGVLNVGYAFLITAFALSPTPPRVGVRDWVMHGVAFALQAAFIHGLLRTTLPAATSLLVAAMVAVGYGGMIEVLQLGVPGRFFELKDLLANAVGVVSTATILAACEWVRRDAPPEQSR